MEYEYVEQKQNDEELKIFLMQNHLHIQKEYESVYLPTRVSGLYMRKGSYRKGYNEKADSS